MKFSVLLGAELEAAEAAIWYDGQSAELGDDFLAELQGVLDRIRRRPAELARLESYHGPHEVRRCLLNLKFMENFKAFCEHGTSVKQE